MAHQPLPNSFDKKVKFFENLSKNLKLIPLEHSKTRSPDGIHSTHTVMKKSGPKILTWTGPIKSGPKYPYHGLDRKNPGQKIRTRTEPIKSGPKSVAKIRTRTGPIKFGPKYPDHGPDRENPVQKIRNADWTKKIRTTDRTGPFRTDGPGNHAHQSLPNSLDKKNLSKNSKLIPLERSKTRSPDGIHSTHRQDIGKVS